MIRRGVPVLPTSRSDPPWESIDFGLYDLPTVFIAYGTYACVSDELEAWIRRWYQRCLEVDYAGGLLPDEGCRLGYPFSLMETWKHFPDQSFQQWRASRAGKR